MDEERITVKQLKEALAEFDDDQIVEVIYDNFCAIVPNAIWESSDGRVCIAQDDEVIDSEHMPEGHTGEYWIPKFFMIP
mgnify:CR=1 FL=1